MSLKPLESFTVVCDWPGCGADINDDNWDYSGTDRETCLRDVGEHDWWADVDGHRHYCNDHPAAWASDPDQIAATLRPFLWIHDGDTSDPDHDGKVTLALAAPDAQTRETERKSA